jgi:hypothetical protein
VLYLEGFLRVWVALKAQSIYGTILYLPTCLMYEPMDSYRSIGLTRRGEWAMRLCLMPILVENCSLPTWASWPISATNFFIFVSFRFPNRPSEHIYLTTWHMIIMEDKFVVQLEKVKKIKNK